MRVDQAIGLYQARRSGEQAAVVVRPRVPATVQGALLSGSIVHLSPEALAYLDTQAQGGVTRRPDGLPEKQRASGDRGIAEDEDAPDTLATLFGDGPRAEAGGAEKALTRFAGEAPQGEPGTREGGTKAKASAVDQETNNGVAMSEAQIEEVRRLKTRDQEVRSHEQAHLSAAGQHARGGIHLDFEQGPDGRRYAVSGHVNIDTAPVPGNPEATIRKANQVRQAALAPASPSGADRGVASSASKLLLQAQEERRAEIAERSQAAQAPSQSVSLNGEKGGSERVDGRQGQQVGQKDGAHENTAAEGQSERPSVKPLSVEVRSAYHGHSKMEATDCPHCSASSG